MQKRVLAICLFAGAMMAASTPARANQDQVQFFSNIEVTHDSPAGDAICFFCSVHAEGEVRGDIVVFFGNVHLDGQAHHDIVNFFGKVTAADNSTIGGDLVSFFGGVHLGEHVTVHQDVVAMFGSYHVPSSASIGKDRVVFSPVIFFAPLLVFVLILFVIVHEVQAARRRRYLAGYPMPPQQ